MTVSDGRAGRVRDGDLPGTNVSTAGIRPVDERSEGRSTT
ncbi:hypothetical protein B005_1619 [Nocardiopsis alba ATCC BAA-2165]|uniref:Uncharacterized protein n=1 Tax=Nocardiopsis alba (strain ATCC BAA-2165 / BE74) TaxID=1205910 RepID=J7L9R7_NOCAA|nr:hypothetical protein B005_1619 [Nocardiopsis alba ATCC BAA-2165]